MPLYSMLRRASSSVLPLAIRAVVYQRSFRSAISAVEKITLNRRSTFIPFLRQFSTRPTSNENLIRVIESEIDCAEKPPADKILDGIPFKTRRMPGETTMILDGFTFKLQEKPGERTILLTREFGDEFIKVEVGMVNLDGLEVEEGDDGKEEEVGMVNLDGLEVEEGDDGKEEEVGMVNLDGLEVEEGDDGKEEEETDIRIWSIPLVVSVSKGNGRCLEFGLTAAFPDKITIDSLTMKQPEAASDNQLAYEGLDFNDLDENLQKTFLKYLEVRGITPTATNYMQAYMIHKARKETEDWLIMNLDLELDPPPYPP